MFIVSRLKIEGALIKQAQEGVDPVEKNAAENLKNLLLVYCQIFIFFRGNGCSTDGQYANLMYHYM